LSQGGMHRSLTPSRWQWCLAARVMAVLQPMRGSNKRRHTSGSGRHTLDYWRDNQWWEHQGCSLVAAEVGVAGSLPCWDLGEEQGRMPEGNASVNDDACYTCGRVLVNGHGLKRTVIRC
jgi:hypothetical protein